MAVLNLRLINMCFRLRFCLCLIIVLCYALSLNRNFLFICLPYCFADLVLICIVITCFFFLNGSNSLSHLRGFILDLSHFSICGARLVLMNGRWRCSDVGDSHAAQIFISLAMPPADGLAAYLAEIKSVINETMVIQYSIVVQYWSNSNVLLGST